MKKIILMFSALMLAGLTTSTYAQTQTSKMKSDSLKDYREFKSDMEKKISENDKKIAELKAKKFEGTREEQDKYNKKIAKVEERNTELRDRISNYKGDMHDKWQSFKREFNHDMKELGTSLKDIGKDNVK